jgi:hypothetical protein
MKHMPQVIAVMTPFPHTADTVEADVPLDRVAAAMAGRHVGARRWSPRPASWSACSRAPTPAVPWRRCRAP